MHSPLSEESSNEPALLRQTTSRVTLGLDDICHSQKFKSDPRRARLAPAKRGRGTGWAGRGGGGRKGRAYLRSWGPPTRPLCWWTRRGSRGPPAQHDRRMRSVARALCEGHWGTPGGTKEPGEIPDRARSMARLSTRHCVSFGRSSATALKTVVDLSQHLCC